VPLDAIAVELHLVDPAFALGRAHARWARRAG
jgi:hypothetical protein